MAVTMETVRAVLDPEEPDYAAAAALGEDALPFLGQLVRGDDVMLAAKATYAAGLVGGPGAANAVAEAARSDEPTIRVAAAAAAANLESEQASEILDPLVTDDDPGVRKVSRQVAPSKGSRDLKRRVKGLAETDEAEPAAGTSPPGFVGGTGLMPGEASHGQMPGEGGGLMPGESGGMPGP